MEEQGAVEDSGSLGGVSLISATPINEDTKKDASELESTAAPAQKRGKTKSTKGVRIEKRILSSVVKVFVVKARVSYKLPWQKKAPKNSTGSGFIVEGKRILTNAHVVEGNAGIMVRRHGSPKRYVATLLCIGYQCDTALLQVEDAAFWEGCVPLSFGGVPKLQDSVTCVGYPTGGDNISVTCGVVSRVDVRPYVGRYCPLLSVQIDAAINSGNSGGPVFKDDKVIGIAFSHHKRAQNIGFIIPVPIVQRFLKEYELRGECVICETGIKVVSMENLGLRKYYHMNETQQGVLVTQLNPLSPLATNCKTGEAVLKVGDVLMAIDGVQIADDYSIPFRNDERVKVDYLIGMKYSGDDIRLTVLRAGVVVELHSIMHWAPSLVPKLHEFDAQPSYLIVGGLVFVPLSVPFLISRFGSEWQNKTPSSSLWEFSHGLPSSERPENGEVQQVVILAQILPSKATVGYTPGSWCTRLNTFQDVKIVNLRHLATLVDEHMQMVEDKAEEGTSIAKKEEEEATTTTTPTEGATPKKEPTAVVLKPKSPFLCFDLAESNIKMILDTAEVVREEKQILRTHSIATAKSADLLDPPKPSKEILWRQATNS